MSKEIPAKKNDWWYSNWTSSTFKLRDKIIWIGVDIWLAEFIINECKATAKNPLKCVKTTVAIYGNESGFWAHCLNNSCWGFIGYKYKSRNWAARWFITKYNRHWYTHTWGNFFYGWMGWLGKSWYCTSESSSSSPVGCPNGAKTFNYFYNKI